MLNLSDDMDDLIRQAADGYPLKTTGEGKDWDKVLAGMQNTAQTVPANNKKYWWLLLLIIPLTIAVLLFNNNNSTQQSIGSSGKQTTDIIPQQNNKTIANNKEQKAKQTNVDTAASQKIKKSSKGVQNSTHTINQVAANTVASIHSTKEVALNKNNSSKKEVVPANSTAENNNDKLVLENKKVAANSTNNNSAEINETQAAQGKTNVSGEAKQIIINKENTGITPDSNKNKTALAPQKDSAATTKAVTTKHTTPVKTKGLYAGAGVAVDITTVKLHEVNTLGYSTSLIVGYRINNNWSVETGLMWDKKNYYSPGKYFNKSNTNLPEDYNIHFLNGTCKMFELPLSIKYDFKSRQLSGFFVNAGISSYIMKKENYNYYVTHYSNPADPGYFKQKDYRNATNNLFSIANISGGYQFIFKNNNSLRLEPYFKIPLKGLGVGKLPFASTGITAAYTLPIH